MEDVDHKQVDSTGSTGMMSFPKETIEAVADVKHTKMDMLSDTYYCVICNKELASSIASRIKHIRDCAKENKIGPRKLVKLKEKFVPGQTTNDFNKKRKRNSKDKGSPKHKKSNDQNNDVGDDFECTIIDNTEEIVKIRNSTAQRVIHSDNLKSAISPKPVVQDMSTNTESEANEPLQESIVFDIPIKTRVEQELADLLIHYKKLQDEAYRVYNEKKEALEREHLIQIGKIAIEKEQKIRKIKEEAQNSGEFESNSGVEELDNMIFPKESNGMDNQILSERFNSTVDIFWEPDGTEDESSEDPFGEDPVFPISPSKRKDKDQEEESYKPKSLVVKIPHIRELDKRLNQKSTHTDDFIEKRTTIKYLANSTNSMESKPQLKEIYEDIDDIYQNRDTEDVEKPKEIIQNTQLDQLNKFEYAHKKTDEKRNCRTAQTQILKEELNNHISSLENLSAKELKSLCKKYGTKSGKKKEEMIKILRPALLAKLDQICKEPNSLHEDISSYIKQNQALYSKVLHYESVSLTGMQKLLSKANIKCNKDQLYSYLTLKGIKFHKP